MLRIACMTLPYMAHPFERALRGISGAGYRYVAFGLPHAGVPVPDENDDQAVPKLADAFARYNLEPIMIIGNDALAPGQPLERARKRLETAKALGIPEVITVGLWGFTKFPNQPRPADEFAAANREWIEHFRKVTAIAADLGIVITVKPHTGNTATARHLRETLDAVGSPALKASYDPGNVRFYEGLLPEEDLPAIAADTVSLIAKDHRGPRANGDFPIPGDGDVDFPRILQILKDSGFAGPIIVERVDGRDGALEPDEADRRIRIARENLERILAAAGFTVSD